MEDRKLATIRKVIKVIPIEGADNIELAQIDGWQCVIKRGEFKEGDLGVYFEIDSVLPKTKTFEFLEPRKYRIRTIKLKGVYSQGLLMPLNILKNGKYEIGDDVTQTLNVVKYIPVEERVIYERDIKKHNFIYRYFMRFSWFRKIALKKRVKSFFPNWISKTDETRIQNDVEGYKKLIDANNYYVTEKIDGSSVTAWRKDKKYGICSRNRGINLKSNNTDDIKFLEVVKNSGVYDIINKKIPYKSLVIQGEFWGDALTKNKYGKKDKFLSIFNVIIDGKRLNKKDFIDFCTLHKLTTVPFLDVVLPNTVIDSVKLVNNFNSTINGKIEGFVVRDSFTTKWSYKILSQSYLLKNESDD
jgi:hypothetical protein